LEKCHAAAHKNKTIKQGKRKYENPSWNPASLSWKNGNEIMIEILKNSKICKRLYSLQAFYFERKSWKLTRKRTKLLLCCCFDVTKRDIPTAFQGNCPNPSFFFQ
jgi:hypothetical protein